MTVQDIDVIVRVAGATLLLWAAFGPGGRHARARRYFIPLALCLTGFLAGNTPDPDLRLGGAVGRAGVILTGYAAVFLWWWCLAVFDRSFRPRGGILGLGVAWMIVASADRGLFGPTAEDWGLSRLLVVFGFAMVLHLGWRLARDRAGDLIDGRRDARVAVAALAATQLLVDLTVDVFLGFDWGPQAFSVAQNAVLLGFVGWLLHLDHADGRARNAEVRPEGVASPPLSAPDTALTRRLKTLLEVDRLHLDPELTFHQFVQAMDAPERTVRRLINQQMGYDHFRTFLNTQRVQEAKRRLADPGHRADKLIAIAMDSGFASLASFNRVFREQVGCSPSAFRSAPASGSEERSADF